MSGRAGKGKGKSKGKGEMLIDMNAEDTTNTSGWGRIWHSFAILLGRDVCFICGSA